MVSGHDTTADSPNRWNGLYKAPSQYSQCGLGSAGLGGCVNRSGALRAEELNAAVIEVLVGFPPPQGTFGVPVRPPNPKSDLQIIEASRPPPECPPNRNNLR